MLSDEFLPFLTYLALSGAGNSVIKHSGIGESAVTTKAHPGQLRTPKSQVTSFIPNPQCPGHNGSLYVFLRHDVKHVGKSTSIMAILSRRLVHVVTLNTSVKSREARSPCTSQLVLLMSQFQRHQHILMAVFFSRPRGTVTLHQLK